MIHLVEAVEADEEVGVDMDVVEVLAVTLQMMRTHLQALEPLPVKVLLKREMLGIPQRDGVMVDEVLTVAVVVEVTAMAKLVKKEGQKEYLNAAVGLDAGDIIADK